MSNRFLANNKRIEKWRNVNRKENDKRERDSNGNDRWLRNDHHFMWTIVILLQNKHAYIRQLISRWTSFHL
jgi:hypothetical protein